MIPISIAEVVEMGTDYAQMVFNWCVSLVFTEVAVIRSLVEIIKQLSILGDHILIDVAGEVFDFICIDGFVVGQMVLQDSKWVFDMELIDYLSMLFGDYGWPQF